MQYRYYIRMTIIDGFQLFCCVSTDNHARVVPYFESCMAPLYPRRYTAKQLKTIYYSLNEHHFVKLKGAGYSPVLDTLFCC